jgi:hypothetical protein
MEALFRETIRVLSPGMNAETVKDCHQTRLVQSVTNASRAVFLHVFYRQRLATLREMPSAALIATIDVSLTNTVGRSWLPAGEMGSGELSGISIARIKMERFHSLIVR